MLKDDLQIVINQQLPNLKRAPSGWHHTNCVLCQKRGYSVDKRKRLGVLYQIDGIGIQCFNCGFKSRWNIGDLFSKSFTWFLYGIGVEGNEIEKLRFTALQERLSGKAVKQSRVKSIQIQWEEASLPDNSMKISVWKSYNCIDENFLKVLEYLEKRRFNNSDSFYWTPETRMGLNKRFILPFYYNNKIVGFTSRTFIEKTKMKYYSKIPNNFLYNYDKYISNKYKYCVVCEGILDAYVVNGISGNGILTKDQVELIKRIDKDTEIIIMPDRDKAGNKMVEIAVENGWYVSFPNWSSNIKDCAQAVEKYGRILTLQSIIENKEKNYAMINVKRKLDLKYVGY